VGPFLAGLLLCFAAGPAQGQPVPLPNTPAKGVPKKPAVEDPAAVVLPEAPPQTITGVLTDKDPFDRRRTRSRHRLHQIKLEHGKVYLVELSSGMFDAYLRVEDAAGKALAEDDDSGGDKNARLLFAPQKTATYRLIATTFGPGEVGAYQLLVHRYGDAGLARRRWALEQQVAALVRQGAQRYQEGRLDDAVQVSSRACAILRRAYPPERFPDGHADLAVGLNNLGTMRLNRGELAAAEPLYREALAMRRKLYPPERCPDGHPHLAASLSNLGYLLQARGEPARVEPLFREALAMRRKLYPAERFPDGHDDLAASLNSLGYLLHARGELARAEPLLREAVAMCRRLYPPGRYPAGHPLLATSLNNLGDLLRARGELAKAEPLLRDALAMNRKLYPPASFPDGHPDLATSLNNLGDLLRARGELAEAEPLLRDTLAMQRKLYPPERYPDGHPDLAAGLNNLGYLLQARGELAKAEPLLRDALAMHRKLYPPARFPDGHPELAGCLTNLAYLLQQRGELARAEPLLGEAVAMQQRLISALLAGSAEAQALNFLAQLPFSRDLYLSLTRALPDRTDSAYHALWHAKGAVAHMLQQRRLALLLASDQTTRDLAAQLAATRRALAGLLRPGVAAPPGRVRELSDRKEELEKQLAERLPLYQALRERLKRGPADLVPLLPPGVVFCDLTRYWHIEHDPKVPGIKGERWTPCYVAFVLARGRPVRRLELGEAGPIDGALAAWRRGLQAGKAANPAALTLRRRLWQPLEKVFPAGAHTVLVAPDAALAGLPWAALPGRRPDTLLLEEYALATLPSAPFLLDLLHGRARGKGEVGLLLAAGGIDYDGAAEPVRPAAAPGLIRAAAKGKEQTLWAALPGTRQELEEVRRLAGKRPVVELAGAAAGTGRLLAELPRARWAHLATHGFFADPAVRSITQVTPQDYQRSRRGERVGLGARSPLVLSGLVCAGANRPVKDAEKEDGGILTAEAVAGLDLGGLELAVLSACDTGLGNSGGGEGVFGLQRAFHLAGARCTVASLWKVEDAATQALMQEFYRNLWGKGLPRLEALRRAQLALLLHYDAKGGKLRAPGTAVPVDPAELARAREAMQKAGRRPLPPLYWAAFTLSGDWR
jgi:CHAT domain-containing protein/tetratricopeptide (TPR) repeat protein